MFFSLMGCKDKPDQKNLKIMYPQKYKIILTRIATTFFIFLKVGCKNMMTNKKIPNDPKSWPYEELKKTEHVCLLNFFSVCYRFASNECS